MSKSNELDGAIEIADAVHGMEEAALVLLRPFQNLGVWNWSDGFPLSFGHFRVF